MKGKKHYAGNKAKGSLSGVKAGHEPRTIHGDGSADSAIDSICREAKQPTKQTTKRFASGGMKGFEY